MDPTVKEILDLPELKECKLLCPDVSASQPVKSLTIMDSPDILDWMYEYEILLSNGSSLVGINNAEWRQFIDGLVARKAAALFIKLHYYIHEIPDEIVEYSRKLDFPIVVVPNKYSWVNISNPIQEYMIARQFYIISESFELRDALNRTITNGGGISDVCQVAADDMGCEIGVFTSTSWDFVGGTNSPIWATVSDSLRASERSVMSRTRLRQPKFSLETPQGEVVFTCLPKRSAHYYAAYWSEDEFDIDGEIAEVKIGHINATLLLCIAKEEELKKIERHYYREFLLDLIEGKLTDKEEIETKTRRLDRVVHDQYRLVVFEVENDITASMQSRLLLRFKQHVNPAVQDIMICEKGKQVILFCPAVEDEDECLCVSEACSIVENQIDGKGLQFGISCVHGLEEMGEAYKEASFAYSMRTLTAHTRIQYDSLGLLKLLEHSITQADTSFAQEFYQHVMGPLISYDEDSDADLVETLKVYFLNDKSVSKAAEALFIHENTLRMRIRRIESLTNRSLKGTMDTIELGIGLILHDFMVQE